MTDIFLSYARQDRERVRAVATALQAEGWDVWMDPSEPNPDSVEATDGKLEAAGAVLVVWSFNARYADHVRSEAATGLYRNRLVQVRLDGVSPPRPFDQVEALDLAAWAGQRDGPDWERVVSAVRLSAGAPGKSRALAVRAADSRKGRPAYLEKRRPAWAKLAGVVLVGAVGAGAWLFDPLGWRDGAGLIDEAQDTVASVASARLDGRDSSSLAPGGEQAATAAELAWGAVDRNDPRALGAFLSDWPETPSSQAALSVLRVLDAQAWIAAVEADTDAAYETYLDDFPERGGYVGAMATEARERLAALGVERSLAVSQIQRGLGLLQRYSGEIDGEPSQPAREAVAAIAVDRGWRAPDLRTAAPRDLRRFGDLILGEAARLGRRGTADDAAFAAAAEAADRLRREQALTAARAATSSAEDLAALELRAADEAAWDGAREADTAEAYRGYLRVYPGGQHAGDARAALTQPFGLDQLADDVRAAVAAARQAQAGAETQASAARARAAEADRVAEAASAGAPGTGQLTTADGYAYAGDLVDGAFTGRGVRAGPGGRYRGDLRGGLGLGLGVLEFASSQAAIQAGGADRYEGQFGNDRPSGAGVTYWSKGDRYAGDAARGVLTYGDGRRYEGDMRDGAPDGVGALWSASGALVKAGAWSAGQPAAP